MRSFFTLSCLLLVAAATLLTGCQQDTCTRTQEYTRFEPVYKTLEEMRIPVTFDATRPLTNPGKIFYYNGYLFVNEINEGIHIYDNTNPESPVSIGFLTIPGNLDMAVNGHYLYVDSYLDLLAIDIADPRAPVEAERVNDVFVNFYSTSQFGYLVEYVPTPVKETIDCNDSNWGIGIWFEGDILMAADASFNGSVKSNSSVTPSVVAGGSMARFTVAENHLYTIDQWVVKVFDVSQPRPDFKTDVTMQWGIETLFPLNGNLFVGSNNGMLIYDISNPLAPTFLATFAHANACDPVVVQDNIAYVTLRSGNQCQGFTNQLDVVDVSNLTNPFLIRTYPMENPHGLSVVDNTLYLCEGEFGLKTFDIENKLTINEHLLDRVTGFNAYDVIVLPPGNHVMVVGEDGLYQFDASDRNDLKELSVIQIAE